MEAREAEWLLRRTGCLSASMLDALMTRGRGKTAEWGQTAITYLYKVQQERHTGIPFVSADARPMRFGRENEEYAIEWLRHRSDTPILNCSTDLNDKFFKTHDQVGYGASPDAIIGAPDNVERIYEIKCVYGEKETCWMFSPTVPMEKKEEHVLEEHGNQILGLLLAFPECESLHLLKYNAPRDDNPFDTQGVLHESRGIEFPFRRDRFTDKLLLIWERILYADAVLKSNIDIDDINELTFKLTEPLVPGVYQPIEIEWNQT